MTTSSIGKYLSYHINEERVFKVCTPTLRIIMVPPGKLGIVLDKNAIIRVIRDTSPMKDQIMVGDKVLKVDDVATDSMNRAELSDYLVKNANKHRTFVVAQPIPQPDVMEYTIALPSGKLGIVIDGKADGGFPTIKRVNDTSPLVGQVQVGDQVMSINNRSTEDMTSSMIADLLKDHPDNPQRIIVIQRLATEEDTAAATAATTSTPEDATVAAAAVATTASVATTDAAAEPAPTTTPTETTTTTTPTTTTATASAPPPTEEGPNAGAIAAGAVAGTAVVGAAAMAAKGEGDYVGEVHEEPDTSVAGEAITTEPDIVAASNEEEPEMTVAATTEEPDIAVAPATEPEDGVNPTTAAVVGATAGTAAVVAAAPKDKEEEDDMEIEPDGTVIVIGPPGKLGLVIDKTPVGTIVQRLNINSPLEGKVKVGDVIVAIDDNDTKTMSASDITLYVMKTAHAKRRLKIKPAQS